MQSCNLNLFPTSIVSFFLERSWAIDKPQKINSPRQILKSERYSLTEGFPSPPKALPPTAARPVNVDGRLKGSANKIGKETAVGLHCVRNTELRGSGSRDVGSLPCPYSADLSPSPTRSCERFSLHLDLGIGLAQ